MKDERNLDKFDRVFGSVFKGMELMRETCSADIPEEWLRKLAERFLPRRKRPRSRRWAAGKRSWKS